MNNNLELKLIDCLDALDAGEPIAQILARYPTDATLLRPMLETAVALPALALEPSASAQIRSRRAFLNRAADMRPTARRGFLGLTLRMGLTLTTILLAIGVASGGTVAASSTALPGEPLYSLKRAAEQVRIVLARDKEPVRQSIAQRRRDEIESLIAEDRSANVEFSGAISARSGDMLRVADLAVQMNADTRVDGTLYVGALVSVTGRLVGGTVHATMVVVMPGGAPAPTPIHVPTPTHAPTATHIPTAKPTLTHTAEPTATHTAEPTLTHTAEPTTEPTEISTVTPRIVRPKPTPRPALPPTSPAEPPTAEPPPAEPPPAEPTSNHGSDGDNGSPPSPGPTDSHGDSSSGGSDSNSGGSNSGGSDSNSGGSDSNSGGGSSGGSDSNSGGSSGGGDSNSGGSDSNSGGSSGGSDSSSGGSDSNSGGNSGGGSGGDPAAPVPAPPPADPTDDHGGHPSDPTAAPAPTDDHGGHPSDPTAAPAPAPTDDHGGHHSDPSAAPAPTDDHGGHPSDPSAAPAPAPTDDHGGHHSDPTAAPAPTDSHNGDSSH